MKAAHILAISFHFLPQKTFYFRHDTCSNVDRLPVFRIFMLNVFNKILYIMKPTPVVQ